MVGGFQESPDAFVKTYFYSLAFLCVTDPSKLSWSYFPLRLNFAVGVQRSASFSLYYKSQIFKALWYKEAFCFKPLDKKTGLTVSVLAIKLIVGMEKNT